MKKLKIEDLPEDFCAAVLKVSAAIRGHRTSASMDDAAKKKRAAEGGAAKARNARLRKAESDKQAPGTE